MESPTTPLVVVHLTLSTVVTLKGLINSHSYLKALCLEKVWSYWTPIESDMPFTLLDSTLSFFENSSLMSLIFLTLLSHNWLQLWHKMLLALNSKITIVAYDAISTK